MALLEQKSAALISQEEDAADEASPHSRTLYRYKTRRPAELEFPINQHEYEAYRALTDLREPYRVPASYLALTKRFVAPEVPEAPLVVFINSRSGGRAGLRLTEVLYRALGHAQVFDLQEYRPAPVLQRIWRNLEEQEAAGDGVAAVVRRRFRILVAGGDGTVAWVLKTVHELGLRPVPPVAVMPLGTGNDLSLSFGWGNTFLQAWVDRHVPIYDTLKRIGDAEPRLLDIWRVSLVSGTDQAFLKLPHSLALKSDFNVTPRHKQEVEGNFFNYMSIGLDAEAAHSFHSLRESHPWAAPSRLVNQAWYAWFGCQAGWFCYAPPIANTLRLRVGG